MHIGIDARFFGPQESGIGRYVERLVTHLTEIDQRNTYTLFLRKRGYDFWQPPNQRWSKVLADYHWYGMAEQRHMPGVFRRAKLDLLHVPHFNVPLLTRSPFVVTIHDLILDEFPTERATTLEPLLFAIKFQAYLASVRHAVRHSRSVITVSEYSKRRLLDRFRIPEERVTVTYESVDPLPDRAPFETLMEHGVKRPYILHVGNSYPHKNLERMVSAVEMAAKRTVEFQCVFVGKRDFFSARLEAEVRRRNIPNILFYGFASDQELSALYQNASAYFFPSLSEGFGLPGLEAMQAGIPVFASRSSCLPEVFGQAASYFDPLDSADIARSIEAALHDTLLRQRLIAAGTQRIQEYSWRRMAEQTLAVYENAVHHDTNTTT